MINKFCEVIPEERWKYLSEEKNFVVILFRICLYCYECLRCYVVYEKNFISLFYSYVRNNVNKSEKDTHSSEEQLN
jgi:hypothetical protein